MKRVDDLVVELLEMNFDGVTCEVSSQGFHGVFDVERISLQDKGEYLEPDLEIVICGGKFIFSLDCLIEKLENPPYKWGYKIVGADIDNNPIGEIFIEIGKKYTDHELIELIEKELVK
ncbi:MAG: hypothetical protein [Bacteriophage sp.]|nr:MAG: hypothetical protein [Bacteriophage sp.]